MTKYELRREIKRLCKEVDKRIGWRRFADRIRWWGLAGLVVVMALSPVIAWGLVVFVLCHFLFKWW